jgi:hypothetical protein
MTSQPVALLLATLGVVPSHSRPPVSDDNPFLRGAVQDPMTVGPTAVVRSEYGAAGDWVKVRESPSLSKEPLSIDALLAVQTFESGRHRHMLALCDRRTCPGIRDGRPVLDPLAEIVRRGAGYIVSEVEDAGSATPASLSPSRYRPRRSLV